MSSKKLYFVLVGLLVLLGVGIVGGAYEADSLLRQRSATLVSQKAKSAALDAEQKQLVQDKKDIQTYGNLNAIATSIVPQDKDQAEAVREIVNIAQQSNIPHLSSISFPTSTLGGLAGAVGATASPTASASKNNLTQLTPVKGIAGVYTLQITVQVSDTAAVPYSTFISFLEKLEQNRRTSQVSNISVTPNAQNPSLVAFTLVIDEYIKP